MTKHCGFRFKHLWVLWLHHFSLEWFWWTKVFSFCSSSFQRLSTRLLKNSPQNLILPVHNRTFWSINGHSPLSSFLPSLYTFPRFHSYGGLDYSGVYILGLRPELEKISQTSSNYTWFLVHTICSPGVIRELCSPWLPLNQVWILRSKKLKFTKAEPEQKALKLAAGSRTSHLPSSSTGKS